MLHTVTLPTMPGNSTEYSSPPAHAQHLQLPQWFWDVNKGLEEGPGLYFWCVLPWKQALNLGSASGANLCLCLLRHLVLL